MEAEIDRLGMPREAVGFQIDTDPIKRHSDTLDSQFDPLVGGPRIDFLASGGGTCTLGYVTDRDLERGIITNSHCSNRFGAVGGDVVSQGGRVIGEETIDADFFTGGVCMAGRRCRFSDSSFIDLDALIASSIGRIARTEVLGWKTINLANPEFRIVDDLPVPSLFDVVNKVGIGTGRTEGAVTDTCMKVADPNSDLDLLCQYKTDYASAPGDSVSPVFRITDSPSPGDVILAGVHWGTVGGVGTFSTIGNIQQDLGLSSSWDNCDPAFSC